MYFYFLSPGFFLLSFPLQDTPVTILVDAVDEGDPSGRGPGEVGTVFTNTALQLVLLFVQLPPCVRLVVTTSRHEHILKSLRWGAGGARTN